ncbi:MAG: ferrochelatase [Gammaproteobacteria bacterium]|nr:ferrochelatase [Gammaproteobacteria bacterium]MBU6510515.1 ferrochelatase [Gammaproteobacteria bacterium]MDE1983974.1 ferrochelatase [Gammaproteobacteria bacterium]MDE2108595.1 ferrochelatase [Gammaproteobacteria bacterium]
MPKATPVATHAAAAAGCGVLLANLGTPDAPTPEALRSYLAEFLSDPDVVKLPRVIWWPLLHGVILRRRPEKSAEAYARIWTQAGSPLLVHSLALAARLKLELATRLGRALPLALGMRYGRPALAEALSELKRAGVSRIMVLALYPQYSGATAGSTIAAVTRLADRAVEFIPDYYAHPGYVAALAGSVREFWSTHERGEQLLISFHGIPQAMSSRGDPYRSQCARTARYLAKQLQLAADQWQLVFQSRFGRARWLQPYTEDRLKQLAAQGVRTVDVICPGFAADCLETLEEIALRYAESFRAAGGRELRYIPALNARPDHVHALADLVMAQLEPSAHS